MHTRLLRPLCSQLPGVSTVSAVCVQIVRHKDFSVGTVPNLKPGELFVGVQPHFAKYQVIWDKKPSQPYGLQGNAHLQPQFGRCRTKHPIKMTLKKDKVYAWCACGYSYRQPLCDGHHKQHRVPSNNLRPVRYIPDRDMTVWLCGCKQTKNRPFCDGSHKTAKGPEEVTAEQTITVKIDLPSDLKLE